MDARDILPYRTPLIGGLVALMVGVTGGLVMRTGDEPRPYVDYSAPTGTQETQAEPIVWPAGKTPDYVIGTDFIADRNLTPPPVVVAAYAVPEYVAPVAWHEPEPRAAPVQVIEPTSRTWASTGGDILNVRLPEDAPTAPAPPLPPQAPEAPLAIAAPAA